MFLSESEGHGIFVHIGLETRRFFADLAACNHDICNLAWVLR
jgi:hypothetical protein